MGGGAVTEEIAPGFRCPTLAHAIGPLRPSVVRDMRLESPGRRVHRARPAARVALARRARAGVLDRHRAHRRRDSRVLAKDAARYPEFCAVLKTGSAAFLGELLETTPPSLDGPAGGAVGPAEDRAALPRARAHGFVPAAPVGADGGGGSRRRMVRDRSPAGRDCGARDLRRRAGTVVRGDRRDAAPQRGHRSGARRQQRDRQGRTGRADGAMAEAATRGGRRDPHRRRGRPVLVRDGRAAGVVLDDGRRSARAR